MIRYLLLALFICLNGYCLFLLYKKYARPVLMKAFPVSIPVTIVLIFGLGFLFKLLRIPMTYHIGQILISAMMSLIVIAMINFANQLFSYMVDLVVAFHQKNNVANIGRQPIKFFIVNQVVLKQGATVIWFLGSALMLYGIWLGDVR